MFTHACATGQKFTRPVVTSFHCVDGQCRSGVGSFVVVNRDGWVLSAWHIFKSFEDTQKKIADVKAQQARIASIEADSSLSKNAKKGELRRVGQPEPNAPLDFSVWWSWDGVGIADVCGIPDADLMLGRLVPFDPNWVSEYPVFKDPSTPILQGKSLVRLGFPFPSVQVGYDASIPHFSLTALALPIFAIEGMLTRIVEVSKNAAGYRNMFLETSSPGLRGQSGGAILDTAGTVWGIQSSTSHLSLGFDPEVPDGQGGLTKRKEHQFLNVGWSTHPETVVGLLKEKGIAHTLAL